MNNTKPSIMTTLFFCMGQGKSHYTRAAINTILELLSKFHKTNIGRRWLFQCLKDFIDEGLIKRKPFYKRYENGLITQIPSGYWFKLKGIVWLVNMGVKGAKEVYKSMVTFIEKEDERSPNRKDFDDGSWKPETPEDKKALDYLLGIVTKPIGQD